MPPSDGRAGDEEARAYLYVVEYDDEAERKRVEYLFNNWEEGTTERPDGLVRIAEGVDSDALYEQLLTKVPDEQVNAYRLEELEPRAEEESITVEETVTSPADAVEPFVEYILSKKKAVLQSAANNRYEVYTKKGRADVTYDLIEDSAETTVRIRVTGYPPAPGFLAEFFETELGEYAASQA